MARLSHLPIDTIKIDRSFIANLGEPNNMAIVRAVVSLGQALNADVLAEGIETAEQLELIKDAGCGFVQGYFTCAPMDAKHLEGYLERHLIEGAGKAEELVLCAAEESQEPCP